MGWVYAAAFLVGISLGLLGSGGTTLTVPLLVYLVGEPEKLAIAESLAIVGVISLAGSVFYIKSKEVHYKSFLYFGIAGMVGAYSGANLSRHLSGTTQLIIFGIILLVAAVSMIRNAGKEMTSKRSSPSAVILILEGLVVGHLTGLVGVGGGFLIVPALVILGGLEMRTAVGTSLMIVTFQCIAGFIKHVEVVRENGLELHWELITIFMVIGIAGSLGGNKIGSKVPQKALKKGFGVFLILMGVFILYKNLV